MDEYVWFSGDVSPPDDVLTKFGISARWIDVFSTSSNMGVVGKHPRIVAGQDSGIDRVLPFEKVVVAVDLHFQCSSSPRIHPILWVMYCLNTLWKSFEIAGYSRKFMLEFTVRRACETVPVTRVQNFTTWQPLFNELRIKSNVITSLIATITKFSLMKMLNVLKVLSYNFTLA